MSYNDRILQTLLKARGFDPGPIDGIRGPKTNAAIVAFKRSVGLRARPYVGPITWAALQGPALPEGQQLPWMAEATALKGLHEDRNTSQLKSWFDGSVRWIDPRRIAWCGAFVATCHRRADPDIAIPENPLGARNWSKFGADVGPIFGATMVFWRVSRWSWQGHVGFYWGEDEQSYHILGGNQSDAVTVTRISKDRLLTARWPLDVPVTGERVFLTPSGVPLSTNEA